MKTLPLPLPKLFLYYQFLFCLIHFTIHCCICYLAWSDDHTDCMPFVTLERKRDCYEREKKGYCIWLGKTNHLHTTPSFYRHRSVIFYFSTHSLQVFFSFLTLNFVRFLCKKNSVTYLRERM